MRGSEAMNNRLVTIRITHGGHPPTVRTGVSADDVGGIIRGLAGEPDVAVKVFWEGVTDERVSLGITGFNVFLVLARPRQLYQYVAHGHDDRQEMIPFITNCEPTDIRSRYVVDIETAAAVVQEWLRTGYEPSSFGRWERR
jgi:hypothetical protein